MKNLPEKIFLNFGEITKEEFETDDYKEVCKLDEFAVTFCEDRVYDTDVEYVRKDAFIKKAVEHIDGLIDFLNEYGHQLKKERIIEDFKNYMEK